MRNKNPPNKGPATVPNKKLDSSLANLSVLFSFEVTSATYAKDAGLVADPIRPFISLPNIKAGNKRDMFNKFLSARKRGVINAINETEYPRRPKIAILRLPYRSLALPQNALVVAQASAEIANIDDVCISVKPRSRASGGTSTKTKDWPRPTVNRPNFNHEDPDIDIKKSLKFLLLLLFGKSFQLHAILLFSLHH